eukprot:TRINITY_DN1386_c0_g1_i4.p1 TRINITY_DN1386_c0_g1~~TRINITY_DN1386_c0_g1_i4.p1  ORF type:complete len:219 (-),score=44.56 TRINITY_DN1386_c0_g1_i4:193-849(-)
MCNSFPLTSLTFYYSLMPSRMATLPSMSKSLFADIPDDFYEFTEEDYVRLLACKKEERFLKTKKIRDAEMATRRARFDKAVIRVIFPDNYVIETTFDTTETISVLMDLLKKVIARPDIPFYIYTTPPKKRITDMTMDFYSLDLVSSAIVRFDYDHPEVKGKGPFLHDKIKNLCNLHSVLLPKEETETAAMESSSLSNPNESRPSKPAARKEKPKWLRM